jgi:8-oxo-dGTP pyrophosphatase MutT (NUDIX family)
MLEQQLKRQGNPLLCPSAVIVKNDCVLMGLRHYRPDKWKKISVWTMPGGRWDEGDATLEHTLRREVAEETGITDLKILEYIGEAEGAKEGDFVPLFYCTTSEEPKLMEPDKFSEWRWFSIEDYISGIPEDCINKVARKKVRGFLQARQRAGEN